MDSSGFVKVFDVLDSGFKSWTFPAFGLIFVVIGLVNFFLPRIIKFTGIPFLNLQSKSQKFFRYEFLGFALLWTSISFFSTYSEHLRHQRMAQENACRIVEGPVENFIPMPYTGHAQESFSVGGVQFRYSDFSVTDGFNNTSSHGGPINKDSYVRICYDPLGNQILRLEIRDFKGQVKDYSRTQSLFPKPGEECFPSDLQKVGGTNPASELPWYSNLFIIFYFLDFIALLNLFVPYLNTFFRLKVTPVNNCKIPDGLGRGRKLKLRNTMLYWDDGNRAIWLRPRGSNLLQVRLMAAKLVTDELGESIVSQEVRFSSGVPFILALFLWTVYQILSLTMPVNSNVPSAGQIVGFAAVMSVVVGLVNAKILTSRMEKLIQDALSELGQI
jgi:hypothetical protein